SGNGRFLLTISATHPNPNATNWVLQLIEPERAARTRVPLVIANPVQHVILSDDGRHSIVIAGTTAQIWDMETVAPISPILSHPAPVHSGAFSHDGQRAATWGGDLVRTWDASLSQG